MSESEYNKRAHTQLQRELAELESPRAKYQQILDRWFGDQRGIAAEERRLKRDLDPYGLGIYDDDFHVPKTGKGRPTLASISRHARGRRASYAASCPISSQPVKVSLVDDLASFAVGVSAVGMRNRPPNLPMLILIGNLHASERCYGRPCA